MATIDPAVLQKWFEGDEAEAERAFYSALKELEMWVGRLTPEQTETATQAIANTKAAMARLEAANDRRKQAKDRLDELLE